MLVSHSETILTVGQHAAKNVVTPFLGRITAVTLNFPRREKYAPCEAAFCQNSLTACF